MKQKELQSAALKARAIAQAAGRKLKETEQRAKSADEQSHQAKLKFKQARKDSKQARKAARHAREGVDEARKAFAKATALATKAEAKASKAVKKAASAKNKGKAKPVARAANNGSRRHKNRGRLQLKPVSRIQVAGTRVKKPAANADLRLSGSATAPAPTPKPVAMPTTEVLNPTADSTPEDASP